MSIQSKNKSDLKAHIVPIQEEEMAKASKNMQWILLGEVIPARFVTLLAIILFLDLVCINILHGLIRKGSW